MDVNFNKIQIDISKRKNEIKKLRQEIGALLVLSTTGEIRVDPDEASTAGAIQANIDRLKRENMADLEFATHARKLFSEHNIAETEPGLVNLGEHCARLENQLYYGIQNLKRKLTDDLLTGIEYESEVEKLKSPIASRIEEIRGVEAELAAMENTGEDAEE